MRKNMMGLGGGMGNNQRGGQFNNLSNNNSQLYAQNQ
jgi:hypothetical protein